MRGGEDLPPAPVTPKKPWDFCGPSGDVAVVSFFFSFLVLELTFFRVLPRERKLDFLAFFVEGAPACFTGQRTGWRSLVASCGDQSYSLVDDVMPCVVAYVPDCQGPRTRWLHSLAIPPPPPESSCRRGWSGHPA